LSDQHFADTERASQLGSDLLTQVMLKEVSGRGQYESTGPYPGKARKSLEIQNSAELAKKNTKKQRCCGGP